jgi:hypothetical protein
MTCRKLDPVREDARICRFPVGSNIWLRSVHGSNVGAVERQPIGNFVSAAYDKDDICFINRSEFPDASFIAIAPVGTGDFWGLAR